MLFDEGWAVRVALAGDTMLGRGVAERVRSSDTSLFADDVVDAARSADLLVVNLECCVSARGRRWPAPDKPFFFRAPPEALAHLRTLGVDAVTLANNHALDYGPVALRDSLRHLREAGIAAVGAGVDERAARRPLRLVVDGAAVTVVAVADHPPDFAAAHDRPGIAYADLRRSVPAWLLDTVAAESRGADVVLVSPHWGPNMATSPRPHVRAAASALTAAGADVVAGHSAHVFHGVLAGPGGVVCFDLGDFVDDYAVDPVRRNDLGLLWFLDIDGDGPARVEALPLALDFCHTRLAEGSERAEVARRLARACAEFGTAVHDRGDRLVIRLREAH